MRAALSRPRPETTAARWPMPRSASARTPASSCRRPRPPSSRRPSAHWARSSCCAMLPSALTLRRGSAPSAARRWCRRLTIRSSWRGRARSGSRFWSSVRRWMRSSSPSAAAGSSAVSPRRSRRSHRTCASTVQSRRCCRAIGRACVPGIRCRWSSSARSRTRSSRKSRGMCASRTWRRTPTALRLWRMMISSAA